mmetsp:Transcript_31840/g.36205  ORF Transcript_31840/g.36205 Transcript_31840/m.36205 type:complete len:164 (-) Transcript_31840:650-1141(-)
MMFVHSSGRDGYKMYRSPELSEDPEEIPRDTLLKLLHEEEKRRFSKEYLERCDDTRRDICDEAGYLRETEDLQFEVVEDAGYSPEKISRVVDAMRTAHIRFPDDEEIRNASVYVRENRAFEGDIVQGQTLPEITLYDLKQKAVQLRDLASESRVTVIVASSQS